MEVELLDAVRMYACMHAWMNVICMYPWGHWQIKLSVIGTGKRAWSQATPSGSTGGISESLTLAHTHCGGCLFRAEGFGVQLWFCGVWQISRAAVLFASSVQKCAAASQDCREGSGTMIPQKATAI